jgi:hypothetical protein
METWYFQKLVKFCQFVQIKLMSRQKYLFIIIFWIRVYEHFSKNLFWSFNLCSFFPLLLMFIFIIVFVYHLPLVSLLITFPLFFIILKIIHIIFKCLKFLIHHFFLFKIFNLTFMTKVWARILAGNKQGTRKASFFIMMGIVINSE